MNAVILSACRTPIGSFGGSLKELSAADLGAVVIREAIARAGVSAAEIGDVIMGCVLQAGGGMNVARQAAIKAGVPVEVPAETVNRVCGSGLQAVVHAVETVKAGYVDLMLAGGTESMSNAPYLLKGARWGFRMGHAEAIDSMIQEGLTCAINGCHMGNTAEEIVKRFGISREDQDAFAVESQRRAAAAIASGVFDQEIVPVEVPQRKGAALKVEKDEYPRATTAEKLAALKAAFMKNGTVTAGNASGINDGAAAVVVMTAKKAAALGLTPLARIAAFGTSGLDPATMGMGPVPASQKALARAGWKASDVDLFELNEAFAAQACAVNLALDIDPAKVNVNGGAIAIGHPIGASGCRILVTLLHEMQRTNAKKGLAALCIGGGMGVSLALER
jgi:acetyl-CoA C-acetyltransferase